jgi:plasmid stabilization system protein ParE
MKRKLVMRPEAELDLLRHCVYLAEQQPTKAHTFRVAAQTSIDNIAANPRSGPTMSFESFPGIELRFRKPQGFKNHLVIYQVTDDCVFVLRILHGAQDVEAALHP